MPKFEPTYEKKLTGVTITLSKIEAEMLINALAYTTIGRVDSWRDWKLTGWAEEFREALKVNCAQA